jgi:UDP-N-acetylglucosamine acyltransferase
VSTTVHPTAVIAASAKLADGVAIGPYAVIGDDVSLGRGTTVGAHASLEGPAVFGEENRIFAHAALGHEPQDVTYHGEKTRLFVGSRNVFREFTTFHRGTAKGRGETVVGDDNYFMVSSHVAHDCQVGSNCVFANYVGLAGHVEIGSAVVIGAYAALHQFARVGDYAFIGAYTVARQDILPFCRTEGRAEAKTYGLNTIGLKRNGFSDERVEALQRAYRLLVKSKLNTSQALQRMEEELSGQPDVEALVRFIRESKRGFHK